MLAGLAISLVPAECLGLGQRPGVPRGLGCRWRPCVVRDICEGCRRAQLEWGVDGGL